MNAREERGVGTAARQGEPHVAHGDSEPGPDLQQREPDCLTLRPCEGGADESEPSQRVEQKIGDGRAVQPELIRAHRRGARSIGEEHHLLLFDSVLHLATGAGDIFMQRARRDGGDRPRGDDEVRVALAVVACAKMLRLASRGAARRRAS